MDICIQQLSRAVAGRIAVDVETESSGLSVNCRDLLGEPIANHVFTHEQLRNANLILMVLIDLERQLLC